MIAHRRQARPLAQLVLQVLDALNESGARPIVSGWPLANIVKAAPSAPGNGTDRKRRDRCQRLVELAPAGQQLEKLDQALRQVVTCRHIARLDTGGCLAPVQQARRRGPADVADQV